MKLGPELKKKKKSRSPLSVSTDFLALLPSVGFILGGWAVVLPAHPSILPGAPGALLRSMGKERASLSLISETLRLILLGLARPHASSSVNHSGWGMGCTDWGSQVT